MVQKKRSHNQQFARRNTTAYPYEARELWSVVECVDLAVLVAAAVGAMHITFVWAEVMGPSRTEMRKCSARSIPVEQLDELVWQDVCEMLTHSEKIAAALYRAQGGLWLPQELQARRENLRHLRE